MEEMHYFKESQREEIPVPDFKDNITRKLLLQFLCERRLRRSPALELKKMRIASISFFAILRFPSRISGRHLAGI